MLQFERFCYFYYINRYMQYENPSRSDFIILVKMEGFNK